jgi:hypothetical protein
LIRGLIDGLIDEAGVLYGEGVRSGGWGDNPAGMGDMSGGFGGLDDLTAKYAANRVKSEKPSAGAAGKGLIKNREMEMKMEFKVEGSKLSGTVEHSQLPGQVEFDDGKIEGDKISFNYVRRMDGQDFKISWTGTISGDEIKFKREYSSSGTGGTTGDLWGDMFESVGLTWNQMQTIDDAAQSDPRGLNATLQNAQKAAIAAALDKNAAEDDARGKIETVVKIQLEIAMRRYDKGLKPILKDITEGQKAQLNSNASWGFQQLFAGGPPGFESSLERSMASSFLKALGIGRDAEVRLKICQTITSAGDKPNFQKDILPKFTGTTRSLCYPLQAMPFLRCCLFHDVGNQSNNHEWKNQTNLDNFPDSLSILFFRCCCPGRDTVRNSARQGISFRNPGAGIAHFFAC